MIPVEGKRPTIPRWEPYQLKAPSEEKLRTWVANGTAATGLAVVCGDVSGGLVCRDYDEAAGFHGWARAHPELAATLPTVRTGRGFHVYFRSEHRGIVKLPDGELLGRGLSVLPPSLHSSGRRYAWINPLPDGPLPSIDPFTNGLAGACNRDTEDTEETEDTEKQREQREQRNESNSGGLSEAEAVQQAIEATLPRQEGERNDRIFAFARHLKGIPSLADASAADVREHVQAWHRRALPVIGTKPFDDTWADFTYGWTRVRFPAGQSPLAEALARADAAERPACAEHYDSAVTHRLVKLCRELQRVSGDDPFFLSCRTVGRLFDMDHVNAWRRLGMLESDGILRAVSRGTKARATRYRYVGDGPPRVA